MPRTRSRDLSELEILLAVFTPASAARKAALLESLLGARLVSADAIRRLHEAACFLQAYPDSAAVLGAADALLDAFPARPDLRRHRRELADSGIVGTSITFPFYAPTAAWLASRWPGRLRVDWGTAGAARRLKKMLFLMAPYCETPLPHESGESVRRWLDRLRGPLTDAAYLALWFDGLAVEPELRAWLFEDLELPLRLDAGDETPSRTHARLRDLPVTYRKRPLDRRRPDLRLTARRRPRGVTPLSAVAGRRFLDRAREAMITRSRDLDSFAYGDPGDVRVMDWGNGLQFACIGLAPRYRFLLESVYAFLILQNGVPVGYALASGLFRSSEIMFNVFETFRGGEAAALFGRVLAGARHLLGAGSFSIDPYQLGHKNNEGLRSGAWWFYRKLGFGPLDPAVVKVMNEEERRMRRDPDHRSDRATLRRLARKPVFFHLGREREDVLGALPLKNVGMHVTRHLADRFGADTARAHRACSKEAASLLGLRSRRGFSAGERHAWRRWSPLVLALPGVERWPATDRRRLVQVIRAKGGKRESDFVALFDAHSRLRRALRRLAGR